MIRWPTSLHCAGGRLRIYSFLSALSLPWGFLNARVYYLVIEMGPLSTTCNNEGLIPRVKYVFQHFIKCYWCVVEVCQTGSISNLFFFLSLHFFFQRFYSINPGAVEVHFSNGTKIFLLLDCGKAYILNYFIYYFSF